MAAPSWEHPQWPKTGPRDGESPEQFQARLFQQLRDARVFTGLDQC